MKNANVSATSFRLLDRNQAETPAETHYRAVAPQPETSSLFIMADEITNKSRSPPNVTINKAPTAVLLFSLKNCGSPHQHNIFVGSVINNDVFN